MAASDDLVAVYTVSNPVKAEIIKNALEGEGIRCFIEGENQAGEAGLIGIHIRLFVPANQVERAARFIEEHERGERRHAHPHEHGERPGQPEPTDTGFEPHSR
jgi:hypothetical protein